MEHCLNLCHSFWLYCFCIQHSSGGQQDCYGMGRARYCHWSHRFCYSDSYICSKTWSTWNELFHDFETRSSLIHRRNGMGRARRRRFTSSGSSRKLSRLICWLCKVWKPVCNCTIQSVEFIRRVNITLQSGTWKSRFRTDMLL